MLTIREALDLPVFATATLVAGEAGLDNVIRWIHIIDIPDVSYEWRRKGVLLLTAGFGMRDDVDRQRALIPKLVAEGFAGLVWSTGYYFDHVPEVIKQSADELSFPIIETPKELLFIEITEAVLERIVNQQYVVLQESNEIYAQLTRLILQGADLNALAQILAGMLQRAVTIEDTSFRMLGVGEYGSVDEVRATAVENGRTPSHIAQQLLNAGIYDKLLQTMGPIYVVARPEWGLSLDRYVAPIIVDRVIYGYIWIIAGSSPLSDLDELTIRHGATVAALMLFKDEAVRKAEESLRGDFFEQLLKPEQWDDDFSEQARKLRFQLEKPHQLLLVHGIPQTGGNGRFIADDVEKWLHKQRTQSLLTWHDDYLAIVIESEKSETGLRLAKAMAVELTYPAHEMLIGVGEPTRDGVLSSYHEAREAIRIALLNGGQKGVVTFADLGLLHWLYHVPVEQRQNNMYMNYINTLAAYDAKRNTELVKTLETYLDQGSSLVEAAKLLYVHRNTLLHRLERIATLCEVNLRSPLDRVNLHVAIKGYRMFGE